MSVKNDYIKLETSAKQIECLKDALEKVAKANLYLMNQVCESFGTNMVSTKKIAQQSFRKLHQASMNLYTCLTK